MLGGEGNVTNGWEQGTVRERRMLWREKVRIGGCLKQKRELLEVGFRRKCYEWMGTVTGG